VLAVSPCRRGLNQGFKVQRSSFVRPEREPLAQRADFAQPGEPLIDRVVVAPDDIGQNAIGDTRFDRVAIQPKFALYVEAVAAAGNRPLGIDRAGARSAVE